ncbi:hematopoietic progenitor cell antigen CD34 [Orycteropus afer afer]|uniref:Hematopoietic progenitor cell antigen CD34 n=1 Tax=Orycteropus afer afer TaxID=1230840 RepID=A0A8B7AVG7_ORYAF|nr:hematopoietic progenitor cell antigen CD34 [Orycteropus afer afer]
MLLKRKNASGFTDPSNLTPVTIEIPSTISTKVSDQEATTPSTLGSTSLSHVPQDSNATSEAYFSSSESSVNVTSTSGITVAPEVMNSSVQSQTSPASIVSTSPTNVSTSEKTLEPSFFFPGNVSDAPSNSTSPMTSHTESYISSPPIPVTIKEDFKKDKGENLIQLLCEKEQAVSGAEVCSLLLAQSEIKPQCLMLVLANRTELSSKFQLMKKHQSDLEKLGIQGFTEENVGSHQSYSRKTLIALVTSGILLAILGTTGYFLMNRRSWSPTGERLGEDPYYTESGGGQGYSSGPGASPEAQGKASVNRGAQENGTGQATSRNGHSARQHMVADTEL